MRLEILSACPDFIRDFLTYNETIKGKSSKSVEQYYSDLRTFFRYMLLVRGKAQPGIPFNKIDISGVDTELVRSVTVSDLYGLWYTAKRSFVTTQPPAPEKPQRCACFLSICRCRRIG